MVFESIVVDCLNRFLGNYVENLNTSQLKLGIWGGDVVLENLAFKRNALEELDIPVQTVFGNLGKLTLKIPWKNLYGASVEATVERLFLIVNPIAEVKYDAEKEDKMALASKRAELIRVEEQKKMEAAQENKLDETFVEKLVAQIIKNVQVTIKDIHIRYEDTITNPKAPFSFGISLHNLSVHTTDENWKECVIQEAVTKIFKILQLDSLAVYWNSSTEIYSRLPPAEMKKRMQDNIASKSDKPMHYSYVLGPINSLAKLKLNRKPEMDVPKFSVPKVILSLNMEKLSVSMSKLQYHDIMMLADSMDRMVKGMPYRKHRPHLFVYRGHYKEWWHFAYSCILEDVRRRRRNWKWSQMKAHRQLCKDYAKAYQSKLIVGKAGHELQALLDKGEKELDLFNLVVIRQKIEMEVERIGKIEAEAKKARGGWFGWWYGSGAKEEEHAEGTALIKQFEKAMTPEEKIKLFRAIDYQDNSAPLHLPVEFVATKCRFTLDRLELTVTNEIDVLCARVDNVEIDMKQRPSAGALRVDVSMHQFSVFGVKQGLFEPKLVTSKDFATPDYKLLNVVFETNPLDGGSDKRVKVSARPLHIVYDAQTVIEIVEVFKIEQESTALTTLQAAAETKLNDLKQKSHLGMQYIVTKHTFVDVDVNIAASSLIIPKKGQYKGEEACFAMQLGAISIKSEPRSSQALDVNKLFNEGLDDEEILKEITAYSYDKLSLTLTEMQIVIATAEESWKAAIESKTATPLHLLQPTNLIILIDRCVITNDPRLPKIKIRGELQKIAICAAEERLLTLCEIIVSMPLPQSEATYQLKTTESKGSNLSLLRYLDPAEKQRRESKLSTGESSEPITQLTEVDAVFVMKEFQLIVYRRTAAESIGYDPLVIFTLRLLELQAIQKTYTLEAAAQLESVTFQHHRKGHKVLNLIDTPRIITVDKPKQHLFVVTYGRVDKKCPEFRSYYKSVEQMIELEFTTLKIVLHLESLQELMKISNEYQSRLAAITSSVDRMANAGPLQTIHEDQGGIDVRPSRASITKPTKSKVVESIQLQCQMKIDAVQVKFTTDRRPLSDIQLQGMSAGLILKSSYTQIDCTMAAMKVEDLNPVTVHKQILKVLGGDMINVQVVLYNIDKCDNVNEVNMSIDAQINCLRIIFLNWFVTSMLEFLNNFQTAQQAIIEASSQAAESARVNVQNAYENSTKISLKVRLAAPIIVVPENSKSRNAILIDFGKMNLSNKFTNMAVENTNNPVTVEELTVDLEDMKVSCINLEIEDQEYTYERKILKPSSFKLYVKRNLSTWFHLIPDLDISGRMHTIAITVGHSDYSSIMKILNQNLQEGKTSHDRQSKPELRKVTQMTSKATIKTSNISKMTIKTTAQLEQDHRVEAQDSKTTIKFTFTMDSFVIDLTNTISVDSSGVYKDVELARFCLALLSFKGRMFSDNSMHCSLLLVDCTLDDTRPSRQGKRTRYLERRRDAMETGADQGTMEYRRTLMEGGDKIRSMIDITYTNKNNDSFIDIRVFSFNLILALDFLKKVGEFVSTGLQSTNQPKKPDIDLKKSKTFSKSENAMGRKKTLSVTRVQSAAAPVEERKPMMTINFKVEQPDIILVESLEQKACDALCLNMQVRMKVRMHGDRLVAEGGISKLQMVVRRGMEVEGPPRYLLAPASVSVALSQPPKEGMRLDVAISDIDIIVSPDTISLLTRVMATMTSGEEQDQEQEQKVVFYDKLWEQREFRPQEYWFLRTEEAEEALTFEEEKEDDVVAPQKPPGQLCLMSSPSIRLSVEVDIGNETIPVLAMQASLNAQVRDWSSQFYMESTWAMQVSYYNMKRATWEPFIEPIEVMKDNQYKFEPWELNVEVQMRNQEESLAIDTSDEAANALAVANRQANTTITMSSHELLELTITNSGLEVLSQLGNMLSNGPVTKRIDSSKSKFLGAPYVLHNCTGLTVKLMLKNNPDFSVFLSDSKDDDGYSEVRLEPGACVPLQLTRGTLQIMRLNEAPPPLKLYAEILELQEEVTLPVERADKRYFPLGRHLKASEYGKNVPHLAAMEHRGLISEVSMEEGALQIYMRSVVQVSNQLSVSVNVYYMTQSGNEVRLLNEVRPGGVVRLPLQAVYTPTAELFFSVEGFTVSVSPFIWRELQQEVKVAKLLQCDSKNKTSGEKFYIMAMGNTEQVFLENTNRHTLASSCYNIELKPVVKMQNCLPVPISVSQLGLERSLTLKPGEMFHLSHIAPNKASIVVTIPNYLDKCWVSTNNLPQSHADLTVWSFISHDSPALMVLDLGLNNEIADGTQILSLYCPFWMLNKTGLTLSYRKSKKPDVTPSKNVDESSNVIFHPADYKDPILFSFRAKNFFGKKKASIRVGFGEWSEKFSLDVPGSSGVVVCTSEGRKYEVAVSNQLSFNSLTKMVIITPFYMIINEAPFGLQYQELHRPGDPWKLVPENSSVPLWPSVTSEDKLLLLRVACSTEKSAPFMYTEQHTSCLKLNNVYGGLNVEVQLHEGGTFITIRQFKDGDAPALLVNETPHAVTFYEKQNVNVKKLPPMHNVLFTWDNPAGPRLLVFEGSKKKEEFHDPRKDGIGSFIMNDDDRIWWVSFLDGHQRVILFTEDPILASGVHTVGEAEQIDTEIQLSMQGIGVSIVNDIKHLEIVYISASNSGIIWQQCKVGSKRYKKIDSQKVAIYEEAYQRYMVEKLLSVEPVPPVFKVDEKTEINFEEMRLLKPSVRLLRRTLLPGLWASYGMGAHSRRIHTRLHRLQVDQQLPMPTFPVVLAPVPPPKSVVVQTGFKPFIEMSIVERVMEYSKVRQYKYFKLLIQECHLKIDMGLIDAMFNMFPPQPLSEEQALEKFNIDLEKALESMAATGAATEQKNFYDNLHLSPLKIHVSFSMGGASHLPSFIGTLLQSIGVTLTDMNDVLFKLSYYERNYEFISQRELISQAQSHYIGQAVKQMYVLVLGLDVIGNPYGLAIGLKKGVEDLFYEPFQGAIQGPGEFAEGLYLGVRSLVGHTVGGAAGAMSRITGAMGHGIAALSLDKDFQRRRRENINKTPANLQEGLARSGKGLVMGIVDGVTGVFMRPLEGAQEEGVEGFLKGLGRGAVGLVARPTAGIVDFASGSFGAVKRAADLSEEVTKRRAPRYLPQDAGVKPYSRMEAEGYMILSELEKGKYESTDVYEAHVWVIPSKEVVMCTDKRLVYLEKNSVFGGWQLVWSYLWTDIPETPTAVTRGVYIPTPKKRILGMFPSSGSGKIIFLYDEQQKKYLLAQCERLMAAAKRN